MVEDNDYITILKSIKKVYRHLCQYFVGFGMGGKTTPKQQNASDIFSLSGNMFYPIIKNDEVIEKYWEVFKRIKVSLPINYSPVTDLVSNFAKYEKESQHNSRLFNLIIISPGVIDDYDKTIQSIKSTLKLPMFITMVKIHNNQLKETNDLLTLKNELDEYDDSLLNLIDFQFYKDDKNLSAFEEEIVKYIPNRVLKYLTDNNISPYAAPNQDILLSVNQKDFDEAKLNESEQKVEKEFSIEYNKDLMLNNNLNEDEEEKVWKQENNISINSTNDSIIEQPSEENSISSSSENNDLFNYYQGNSLQTQHKLAYSTIFEEDFIKSASVDISKYTIKDVEALAKSGKIFDCSSEYLNHLLRLENGQ